MKGALRPQQWYRSALYDSVVSAKKHPNTVPIALSELGLFSIQLTLTP